MHPAFYCERTAHTVKALLKPEFDLQTPSLPLVQGPRWSYLSIIIYELYTPPDCSTVMLD